MSKRFLGREGNVDLWYYNDEASGTFVIEEVADAQPVLDLTSSLRSMQTDAPIRAGSSRLNDYERKGIQNGFMHVASIDPITQTKWMREGIYVWKWNRCDWTQRKIKQKLNSPEWKYLRTGNARI